MDYEEPSCSTCKHRKILKKYDYSKGGCKHSTMEGFICLADDYEGIAIWMVGIKDGGCECYEKKHFCSTKG